MFPVGSLVKRRDGGPVMEVVSFVCSGTVAVCKTLWSGIIYYIAVASLVFASGISVAEHQHLDDDPTPRGAAQQYQPSPPTTSPTSSGQSFSGSGGLLLGGSAASAAILDERPRGGVFLDGSGLLNGTTPVVIFTKDIHYLMRR
jgi:hypothetical protein